MRCAGSVSDDHFWTVHDALFKYPTLDPTVLDDLDKFFDGEGLAKFKVCREEDYPVGVQRDIKEGDRVALRSTPTIFINGKLAPNSDPKILEKIIEEIARK